MADDEHDERRWVEAGLLDPASSRADERRELLAWLASRGVRVEQMVEANDRGQLDSLAGDLVLRPGPRCTMREVAARIGWTIEAIIENRRATGLPPVGPDEPVFTEGDVTMLGAFQRAGSVFSHAELTHLSRVMGNSMRRIAEAASEMFLLDVEAPLVARGTSELELARSGLAATELTEAAIAVFDPMFRAHLEESTRASRQARAAATERGTLPLAVGFVDLTQYTSRTGRLDHRQLLDLVLAFEASASDIVADHGGRVVKLIGDEVMFTTVGADDACAIALELLVAMRSADADGNGMAGARGGVAYGPVVAHGGDLYGETVNRAARMTEIAVPGEVLVDASTVDRATHHRTEPAGRRVLKGFAEPVRLWTLDGAAPPSGQQDRLDHPS